MESSALEDGPFLSRKAVADFFARNEHACDQCVETMFQLLNRAAAKIILFFA
jgi:hypothetical protein